MGAVHRNCKGNEKNMTKFKYFCVLIFFVVEIVPEFHTSSLFWWVCVACLCAVYAYDTFCNSGTLILEINAFVKWYGLFVGYAVLSFLWASNRTNTWAYIPSILLTLLICTIVSQIIRTKEDLEAILFVRYLSSVILCLYIYTNIDLSVLGNERIGVYVLGEGWNSNGIAIKLTIGCILGVDQIRRLKNRYLKILVFASVIGMFSIMMLCGSRTAFMIAVVGIMSYIWLTYKNKWIIMTGLVIIGVMAVYNLVMVIPELYNVLGYRLEILEQGLAGNTTRGSGTEVRLMMLTDGLKVFYANPILGVGMNNFRNVFGDMYGVFKYSHSNHIEILADFGLVGFVLYYSGFIYLGVKGMRNFFYKKQIEPIQVLTICTILILIISGFGTVYYYGTSETLMLAMCYSGLSLLKRKRLTDTMK